VSTLDPAASLNVTPNANLQDGNYVQASGSGFPPGVELSIRLCPAGATDLMQSCGEGVDATVQADGSFNRGLFVLREFLTPNGYVTCGTAGACVIAAAPTAAPADLRSAPLQFDPPLNPPSMLLLPMTPLHDREQVLHIPNNVPMGWRGPTDLWQCRGSATSLAQGCQRTAALAGGIREVRYTIHPEQGPPFTCSDAEGCKLVYTPDAPGASWIEYRTFFLTAGEPRLGQLQFDAANITVNEQFPIEGSGWTTNGTALVEVCPKRTSGFGPPCWWLQRGHADENGAFSIRGAVPASLATDYSFVDCAAAAGACVMRVQESRDPSLVFEVPLTVEPLAIPAGTVVLEPGSALVDGLPVRIRGSGWQARTGMKMLLCNGEDMLTCIELVDYFTVPDSGVFEQVLPIPARADNFGVPGRPQFDCRATSACSLIVGPIEALGSRGTRIPLTFSTSERIDVTSSYEPRWHDLLAQGVSASGKTVPDLQYVGAAVMLYLMNLSGGQPAPPFPLPGSVSYTTSYSATEYLEWSRSAMRFGRTLEEVQKEGALLWSWLLAGRPPIPPAP
jgi:hypothetical protein